MPLTPKIFKRPRTIKKRHSIHFYISKAFTDNIFACFCALEPMPVLELVSELDPVLALEVASSPELKPVPVLELELGFE